MQKSILHGMITLLFCALTACANNSGYDHAQLNENLLKETWMQEINLKPNQWIRNADPWYRTGSTKTLEKYNTAPASSAITTSAVRVPEFTDINLSGDFQVQIAGGAERNSVFIVGPNAATRQISVEMLNNTLYIHKIKEKESKTSLRNVIVRINISNLRTLKNTGSGPIYGRNIMSDHLAIYSSGFSNIFLSGNMNVARIDQTGSGTIAILGANTPYLNINVNGNGNVKMNGHVGVQAISHNGNGEVMILGADSHSLIINAQGNGSTNVVGYVNLKKVVANNNSRVSVYWLRSNGLSISASDQARINLAGAAANMDVDILGIARFNGQYLRGSTVYVKTRNSSHANVTSDKKLFAAALDSSSIYLFGSPTIASKYTSQRGAIIPIWTGARPPAPTLLRKVDRYRSYK